MPHDGHKQQFLLQTNAPKDTESSIKVLPCIHTKVLPESPCTQTRDSRDLLLACVKKLCSLKTNPKCVGQGDQGAPSTSEAEQRKLFDEAVARVNNWIGPAMKKSEVITTVF